ncbi:MAG: hypothetical protein M3463_07215 [Verrucomicrobiota bacterium]|nr:hypothetical protein [Verrucomicrobiota bacterium]
MKNATTRKLSLSAALLGLGWPAGAEPPPFPQPPPIADANSAFREEREVLVPTAFKAFRTDAVLVVSDDHETLKTIKLMVGSKMVLGMSSELYIYPVGGVRPAQPQRGRLSGPPRKGSNGTSYFYPKGDGFRQPGKRCILELDIAIFETDSPAQHMWMPQRDKYKVLWRTTLRKTVEESAKLPDEIREQMERVKPQPMPPAK